MPMMVWPHRRHHSRKGPAAWHGAGVWMPRLLALGYTTVTTRIRTHSQRGAMPYEPCRPTLFQCGETRPNVALMAHCPEFLSLAELKRFPALPKTNQLP